MNATNILRNESYCGSTFDVVHRVYRYTHGYTSSIVCIFGSVANLLNIIVLTRREMISPTNAILTGLAVADLLVMVEYMPYSWHRYLSNESRRDKYTYLWAIYIVFHAHVTQVFHTISISLTVILAVWRYIAVVHPQKNREWCGMQRTIVAITCGYGLAPIIFIPLYLSLEIKPSNEILDQYGNWPKNNATEMYNTTIYLVTVSELGSANLLADINFWVYGVVIKIIPCILLTILSGGLICALMDAKRRRKALISGARKSQRNIDNQRQTDRTTKMLLAVLILFLITELPQGILILLSVILGQTFFEQCYNKLGDIMDILALINSAINFMIYCAMSRQFRITFSVLFRPRWLPVSQLENNRDNETNQNHTTMISQV